MGLSRAKTTLYIDAELLREVKTLAASSGRADDEIVEDALRRYLHAPAADALRELMEHIAARGGPGDAEALDLAYGELDAARRDRSRA